MKFFRKEMYRRTMDTYLEVIMMGTNVFINDKGNVEVKVLTTSECLYWDKKIKMGEVIPEGITIYNESNLTTQLRIILIMILALMFIVGLTIIMHENFQH